MRGSNLGDVDVYSKFKQNHNLSQSLYYA